MTEWMRANRLLLVAVAAPAAVVAVFYLVVVRPRAAAGRRAEQQSQSLRARVRAVPVDPIVREPEPAAIPSPSDITIEQQFERRVAASDRVPDLVERFARVALDSAGAGQIRGLKIETGDRMNMPGRDSQRGPRVAGDSGSLPDPRLGLFGAPIAYTHIAVSFEATYAGLGRFLWNLRALPTAIEIRTLEVTRPTSASETGLLRIELGLYALQRGGSKTS